ncbi:MAG TPA: helix-turn-helix domain-containing protein [Steroidobacteraceae bacterium]|nr:helix-turn-helix domain-containing protein [Steroidobacteraceae bacterium]
MQAYTTRGLPAPHKLAFWNALSSESIAAMEVTPRDVRAFEGEMLREAVGPLTVIDVRSAAVRLAHTRAHVRRLDTPSYILLAPLRGRMQLSVDHGDAVKVETGDLCLLDHARTYQLEHGDGMRTLCVDIPRATLEALLPAPQRAVGVRLSPRRGAVRLLAGLLRELGAELQPGAQASFTPAFAQGLMGFIAEAYAAEPDCLPESALVARGAALRARIDARLAEPDLAPRDIAREAGISERRLRALLAAAGEGFGAYLLRRRLERCAGWLRHPAWRQLSITQIAFRAGFNNATHFGHAFRQRYGMAPRDWRATR